MKSSSPQQKSQFISRKHEAANLKRCQSWQLTATYYWSLFFHLLLKLFLPFPGQTRSWKSVNEFHKYYSLYFPQQLKSGGIRFHSPVRRLARLQSTFEIPLTLSWGDNGLCAGTCSSLPSQSRLWHSPSSCKVPPTYRELDDLVPKQNLPVKSQIRHICNVNILKMSWACHDSKVGWIQVPCWLQRASPGGKQVLSTRPFSYQK